MWSQILVTSLLWVALRLAVYNMGTCHPGDCRAEVELRKEKLRSKLVIGSGSVELRELCFTSMSCTSQTSQTKLKNN